MTVSLTPVSHGSAGVGVDPGSNLHRLDRFVHDDVLAVDHLEGDVVDVHRVGVLGGVVELPYLDGASVRVLGERVHPFVRGPHPGGDVGVACHRTEHGLGGAVEVTRHHFEHGEPSRDGLRR